MKIHIEPLGTEVILPAVVVGFELTADLLRSTEFTSPDWFSVLDQQAGGYGMSYPCIGGIVLRLNDNKQFLIDSDIMIKGFKAMGEDADMKVLREYPDLEKLVLTHGHPYSNVELQQLSGFIKRFGRFPSFESGIEAFTIFEHCDLVEMFGGWNVLNATATTDLQCIYNKPDGLWVDESNIQHLELTADDIFTNEHLISLQTLSSLIGAEEPRAYFLWENSD